MEIISLRNFKSYENHTIPHLNSRINVILGSNGQGKSNLFKAISFVLTDKTPLNSAQHNTHLHKALDPSTRPLAVELFIRPKNSDDFMKLERAWIDEHTQQFRVQGKMVSKNDFEVVVQSLGLSYSNPYNILQQGKVNQVTLMDDFDLYKLLEEATGIKKYEQRHAQALSYVTKNQEQKEQMQAIMKELQSRLETYQSMREQHEYYSFEEKAAKVKNYTYYQTRLKQFNKQIEEITEKESQSAQTLTKTKNTIKDINNELEQITSALEVNNKRLYQYSDASTQEESFSSSHDIKDLQNKMKEISAKKRSAIKKLEKTANIAEKIKKDLQTYKEKHEALTNLMSATKITKEGKEELKLWIKKAKDNLKQVDSELNKATKLKSDFKIKSQDKQNQEDFKTISQKLEQVNNELRTNKIKCLQATRTKNQYQSEVEVFGKQVQLSYSQMRKVLPLLEFNLLNQIKAKKLPGVYGYLIQYLDIHPTVLFAYESAGLNRLCTILVENESTVSSVITLNKQLKGKQIQILPLSFANRSPAVKKNIPAIDDCYSLLNEEWLKIKSHPHGDAFTKTLQKILINTFGGHVLVKDYDLGLKVSKEYHLTCITADRQIVYSEGYLCRVGKDNNVDSRFQNYFKYSEKCNQFEESTKKLTEAAKKTSGLLNQSIELQRKKGIISQQLNNIKLNIDIINEEKKTMRRFEEEETKLFNKKEKLQSDISSKEDLLLNFEKKNLSKVDPKQYKETQEKYQQLLSAYNKQSQNQCQYQHQLSVICKEEEEIQQKLKNVSFEVSFREQNSIDVLGNKEFQGRLAQQREDLQHQKKALERQLGEAELKLETEHKQNYDLVGKLSLIQQQLQFCKNQLTQIGDLDLTLQQIQQKSNSFSVSLSRLPDHKKIRVVTAAEKLLFSKMQSFYQRFKEAEEKIKQLQEVSKQIYAMIDDFEKEKDKSVGIMFSNFQKYFEDIFKQITGNGTTDVRLKKSNQRNRGLLKVRNSLSILVSFDQRGATRKWSEFSGGQKTVVAVCLLMALQKCQPAPFYIFDQADAALDPVYLQRISELIVRESKNAQYFISSFKRGMTSFSGDICNYYLVESRDRVSSIRRIDPEEAEIVVEKLAQG